MEKKKKFIKNTIKGKQSGSKYPESVRAACLYALLYEDNIHKVAQKYNVPESTLRTWHKKAVADGQSGAKSAFVMAREEELRRLNYKASTGARLSGEMIVRRLEASEREKRSIEELYEQLDKCEDESEKTKILDKLKRLRPVNDFAIANYLRTLTSTAGRAAEMLGEEKESSVVIKLEGETLKYAE